MNELIITPLDIIKVNKGDVMHAMKSDDPGFSGFGEAYFSVVSYNAIKAWKRHHVMTLNQVVPVGKIRFVLFDDRKASNTQFQEVIISKDNYCRLTVPPMVWIGFEGLSDNGSMLLNIADIQHNPHEVDKKNIEQIEFNWSN
jgi:dTDP-4-dehydrorhamnose 3,5-epimerase